MLTYICRGDGGPKNPKNELKYYMNSPKGCVNLTPIFQIRTAKWGKDHCHCKTGQSEHVSRLYVELLL